MEPQILDCYQQLKLRTRDMLDAARENDSDALVAAEADCAILVERLRVMGDGTISARLSPDGERKKMAMIRELLRLDAQIREATQPWLARLEVLMNGQAIRRRLDRAYG